MNDIHHEYISIIDQKCSCDPYNNNINYNSYKGIKFNYIF